MNGRKRRGKERNFMRRKKAKKNIILGRNRAEKYEREKRKIRGRTDVGKCEKKKGKEGKEIFKGEEKRKGRKGDVLMRR